MVFPLLRPDIFLVHAGVAHVLHELFTFLRRKPPLLSHDLAEDKVNFASHVGGVAADVKGCPLLKQLADKSGILPELVLYVNFLAALA